MHFDPLVLVYIVFLIARSSPQRVELTMENATGYVQRLSPTKKGRKRNIPYFDFFLQIGEDEKCRAVCFHESLKDKLKSYQESGIPVKLRNITKKKSLQDPASNEFLLNDRTVVEKASTSGLHFENKTTIDEGPPEVLIENIESVQSGQQLIVKGTLTMDLDEVRTIQINGNSKKILDAAYISDNTGIELLIKFLYDKS